MSSTLCDVCDKDSRYMRTRLENAKLRELVADMWPHVRHRTAMCNSCDVADECAASDQPCMLYGPLEARMRELGIEVDK